jgi:O-antigen/teichoic acid export membrane protein
LTAIGATAELTDLADESEMAATAASATAASSALASATLGQASTRRLARDSIAGFGLNIGNLAATILASIVLARTMDVAQFGLYSWGVALATLLVVPAVLGVDRLLVRDIASYSVANTLDLIRGLMRRAGQLVLVTSAAILVLGAVVVVATAQAGNSDAALVIAAALVAVPLLAMLRITQSALMGFHHVVLGQFAEILLRPWLFLIAAIAAALILGPQLDAAFAVALYAGTTAVCVLVAFALLRTRTPSPVRASQVRYDTRRWVIAGISLVVLSGGLVINAQTGVLMLGVLDTPAAAGIYSVAQRGALLVSFPLVALNAAIAPTAARLWAARRHDDLQRLVTDGTRGVVLASLPIALLFIFGGSYILSLVYGPDFESGAGALAIVCLGQLVNAATGSVTTLLIMTGNQLRAAIGLAAGIAVNVILCVLLIPTYHATGAAIAASASLIVSNVIHVLIARSSLGIDSSILARKPKRDPGSSAKAA